MTTANEVIVEVVEHLERLGIPYYLGGSYASALHGIPRSTRDADLVVDMSPAHGEALATALGPSFYADAAMRRSSIAQGISFNVIHLATQFKIDFYPVGANRLRRAELDRRAPQRVGGREVQVASAEETLLAKLCWFREGGEVSDRQWGDIRGIVEVQGGRLDRAYLEQWASELGVGDLLEQVLREVEPSRSTPP